MVDEPVQALMDIAGIGRLRGGFLNEYRRTGGDVPPPPEMVPTLMVVCGRTGCRQASGRYPVARSRETLEAGGGMIVRPARRHRRMAFHADDPSIP